MKGYKGFSKGLICKGKQYAENTVFEEEKAEICKSGMHFCENPLDILDYYPLIDNDGNMTEFAEVEALDEVFTDDNKKYCTKKLKVGAKLSLSGFINASVEATYNSIKKDVNKKVKDEQIKAGGSYSTLAGGDNSTLAGGYNSTLAGGYNSILVGDNGSIAKGQQGSLIVLVEREWKNGQYIIKSFKAELVDGEKIKADTWYELVNGEFVEV